MLRAVLFDMDGVLVDSEPLHFESEGRVFGALGIEVTLAERHSFVGMAADGMWKYLKETYSLKQPVTDLVEYDEQSRVRYFSGLSRIPAVPGAGELLQDLAARGIRLALVSSSSEAIIGIMMEKTGFGRYFDLKINGRSVKNGKPAPDIFLSAAKLLGEEPRECVVIEDSRNGVRAAVSAGMKCVGFRNPNSGSQDLSGADSIVDEMGKIDYDLLVSLQGGAR